MNTPPRRVLVVYTGGTIGMLPGPRGYQPVPGYLRRRLEELPQFHVPGQPPLTLPPFQSGSRVHYDVVEHDPILDSSCMATRDWVRIARTIEAAYDDYDGFVVLHGTDTMAYTASALSFMLVDNHKPVVLTGSQIPLARLRNDAVDNLLGALVIAGEHPIGEVTLYFHNRLLRGNRARKVNAAGFDAFESGNLRPLAEVGIGIEVDWELVRQPEPGKLRVRPILNEHVAAVRLFPGLSAATLERLLQPPLEGVVLETYGTGNAPDDPAFLEVLRAASRRGLVIVNVTQCLRGSVSDAYATGAGLAECGVVSGHDMTPEAALTKLAYLLSLDLDLDEVRQLVGVDLRGELTSGAGSRRSPFEERAFVAKVARELGAENDPRIGQALYPVLLCAAARAGDLGALGRMVASGVDPSSADYDGRTALHVAAAEGREETVRWLLQAGARCAVLDRWGRSPADDARAAGHGAVAALLSASSSLERTER